MKRTKVSYRRLAGVLLMAVALPLSGACATLAHSTSSGHHARHTDMCEGNDGVCPWLIADAAWLLAGIVPGVVCFVVDFGTGAWKHDTVESTAVTASDDMTEE